MQVESNKETDVIGASGEGGCIDWWRRNKMKARNGVWGTGRWERGGDVRKCKWMVGGMMRKECRHRQRGGSKPSQSQSDGAVDTHKSVTAPVQCNAQESSCAWLCLQPSRARKKGILLALTLFNFVAVGPSRRLSPAIRTRTAAGHACSPHKCGCSEAHTVHTGASIRPSVVLADAFCC